jgi:hypothetical protein
MLLSEDFVFSTGMEYTPSNAAFGAMEAAADCEGL